MKLDPDDPWRLAWRARQQPGSASCPDPDRIASLMLGEDLTDRTALADHVAGCRRCTVLARDTAELDREATLAAPRERTASRTAARPRGRTARVGPVVATTGAILVVVLWLLWPRPSPTVPEEHATTVAVPGDGVVLPAPPPELVWPERPGAASYRVGIHDLGGNLLWESPPVAGPPLVLPEEVRALLAAGGSFTWRVRFDDGAGAEREDGQVRRFTVAPAPGAG